MLGAIKRNLGIWAYGISLNLDIINACGLKCPSCFIGSVGNRPKSTMDYLTYLRLLNKFRDEKMPIRRLQLYIDSDPCLHPDLHRFVGEATRRGIKSYISTMLQSSRCDFAKVIEARPTEFRISMPGWEQMSRYQGGAKPEVFDRNFEKVCRLPRHKETTWTLFFHSYPGNEHEKPKVRQLAEENGLKFVSVPAIFMVLEKVVKKNYTYQDMDIISSMWETPEAAAEKMKKNPDCACFKQLAVDARGKVFLCELVGGEEFVLGNVFDRPIREWLKIVRNHDFCKKCIDCKANVLQECFADPVTSEDPVGDANKRRMK